MPEIIKQFRMKKTALLFAFAAAAYSSHGQLSLSGTSYTQDFNNITSALPTGWYTYNSATTSSLGIIEAWSGSSNYGRYADTVNCGSDVNGGGAKNYPSANNGTAAKVATCAAQKLFTDRAVGFRQVSQTNASHPNLEPGAAFVLKIANTTGLTNFNLNFKLQSLDTTCPRTTTWTVDYATGATPSSFTPVTPTSGTMTTGNLTFSNNTINVNFGSALDNKSTNVWIRIAALTASTGTGTRPSTAIDDFNLSWTGTANGVEDITNNFAAASLSTVGQSSSDNITFAYNVVENGKYNLSIFDMTGRKVYDEVVNATQANHHTVSGLNLPAGFYVARLSNGTATATAKFGVN